MKNILTLAAAILIGATLGACSSMSGPTPDPAPTGTTHGAPSTGAPSGPAAAQRN